MRARSFAWQKTHFMGIELNITAHVDGYTVLIQSPSRVHDLFATEDKKATRNNIDNEKNTKHQVMSIIHHHQTQPATGDNKELRFSLGFFSAVV